LHKKHTLQSAAQNTKKFSLFFIGEFVEFSIFCKPTKRSTKAQKSTKKGPATYDNHQPKEQFCLFIRLCTVFVVTYLLLFAGIFAISPS